MRRQGGDHSRGLEGWGWDGDRTCTRLGWARELAWLGNFITPSRGSFAHVYLPSGAMFTLRFGTTANERSRFFILAFKPLIAWQSRTDGGHPLHMVQVPPLFDTGPPSARILTPPLTYARVVPGHVDPLVIVVVVEGGNLLPCVPGFFCDFIL